MSEHIDEFVNQELADYIAKCRAMHSSHVAPVPRFAHAVAALADKLDEAEQSRDLNHAAAKIALNQRDALFEALQCAADSFRSHGFAVDADACEDAIRSVRPSVPASEGRWLVWYEDGIVSPEHFSGAGAEAAARGRYAQARQHWSVHLFQCVDSEDAHDKGTPRPSDQPGGAQS